MDMLRALREANPRLRLYSVLDSEFAPYGRVLPVDAAALTAALAQTPIPEEGNAYVASLPELEDRPEMPLLRRLVYGELPLQAGYCNGNGFTLNAEEYHKCSEVNLTDTGLVLLLALPGDLRAGQLDSERIKGFYLPPGVPVEIYPLVMHFAPCRIRETGFRCLVLLTKGTNGPLAEGVKPQAPGEEALLWMVNKWMLCHPDSPQAAKGAYVGIRGENLRLNLPRSEE